MPPNYSDHLLTGWVFFFFLSTLLAQVSGLLNPSLSPSRYTKLAAYAITCYGNPGSPYPDGFTTGLDPLPSQTHYSSVGLCFLFPLTWTTAPRPPVPSLSNPTAWSPHMVTSPTARRVMPQECRRTKGWLVVFKHAHVYTCWLSLRSSRLYRWGHLSPTCRFSSVWGTEVS